MGVVASMLPGPPIECKQAYRRLIASPLNADFSSADSASLADTTGESRLVSPQTSDPGGRTWRTSTVR